MNPEPNDNSNRDDLDRQADLFVQQQLESLDQPEPMTPEFVGQLSRRLDAEFSYAIVEAAETAKTSGEDESVDDNLLSRKQDSGEMAADRRRRSASNRRRRLSRWLGAAVTAAVLLTMFSFWAAQPLTSWAEMIAVLKSAPWVQTDSGRTSSWFSASSQIVARRDVNQTVFTSKDSGFHYNYVRDDARIYQSNADADWRPLDRELIVWLAKSMDRSIDPDVDWAIVSESARQIDDAAGRWWKLAVVFESSRPSPKTFTAVFTVNPKTKMPVSCEVREGMFGFDDVSAISDWQTVSFDYPTDGPSNIFDLGVAADTPLELSAFDTNAGLVSTNVPEVRIEIDKQPLDGLKLVERKPKPTEEKSSEENPEVAKPSESELLKSLAAEVVKAAKVAKKKDPVSFSPKTFAKPAVPIIPIPASSVAMTERVDQLVDDLWTEKELSPADPATDETFLRRVYLDVVGRVPTISEYDQFFELDSQSRRSKLIDSLLDSREHALHMGGIWKRVLVPDDETAISRLGGSGKLEQWLSDAFAEDVPYDELVRQLLLAEGRVNESGPLLFYAAAKMNAEELAARTSRTFLGMRMECAQCHDHPFDHWTQEEFWGLAAFFAQISRPQGKIEMVSPVLRVRDADFGDVKLPETETVIEPKLPISPHESHGMSEAEIANLSQAEVTGGSRRAQLAAWVTHPQNSHFAQATVNRIWGHVFGRGLVDPIDDMGGHNEPVSPQLLHQLGRYFVQSDFDLKELMRVLLNSRAYQLSSINDDKAALSQEYYFARMPLKPLTAEQLYDCLATSTGRSDLGKQVSVPMGLPLGVASNVDRFSDPGRAAFLAQFRTSIDQRTDYQAGIPQALTLMNGPMIASATADAPKGILRSLSAPFFDDATRLDKLFVATLSRKPTDQEKKRYSEFLSDQPDGADQAQGLGDVLWVLLNSTEFTMNH